MTEIKNPNSGVVYRFDFVKNEVEINGVPMTLELFEIICARKNGVTGPFMVEYDEKNNHTLLHKMLTSTEML